MLVQVHSFLTCHMANVYEDIREPPSLWQQNGPVWVAPQQIARSSPAPACRSLPQCFGACSNHREARSILFGLRRVNTCTFMWK